VGSEKSEKKKRDSILRQDGREKQALDQAEIEKMGGGGKKKHTDQKGISTSIMAGREKPIP